MTMTAQKYRIFADFSLRQAVSAVKCWILQDIRWLVTKRRYLTLSPPFLCRQFFYDRKNKTWFSIKIRNYIDWGTSSQIYYDENYGLEKFWRYGELKKFYDSCIHSKKSPLIIDCGGNIGLASRYFGDTYPGSKILCIEPDPENLAMAKKNNQQGIVFFQSAVGSSNRRGTLVDPGLGNNAYRVICEEEGSTEILSLNGLLERYATANASPFIVKIDVEGFEAELFSQHTEWIEQFPILIIELHDRMFPNKSNSSNFLKTISKLNRDFLYCGENIYSISNTLLLSADSEDQRTAQCVQQGMK